MKELDEDMLYELKDMNEQAEAPKQLAAVVTNRHTVVISDKTWICEWSLNNIEDMDNCPELDEMFALRDTVFNRPDEVKTTPWAKLLFPERDRYVSCDEDDLDDEDAARDTVSFVNADGLRMSFERHYVEVFHSICEEPEFEMYMLTDTKGVLIVYDNGKRIGCVLPIIKSAR